MNKKDWFEAGDQIRKLVLDAVDSGDFSQLANTVADVVNDTVDEIGSVLKENLGQAQNAGRSDAKSQSDRSAYTRNRYDYTNSEAADRIRRNMQARREQYKGQNKSEDRMYRPTKAKLKVPGEITAKVMKWTGYGFSGAFGLSLGLFGIISLTTGIMMRVPIGILAILFGGSIWMGMSGSKRAAFAKRFRRYHEVLGDRTYCLIEELANAIGQSHKFVQKDLKKMIGTGLFKEGYMDRKETLLITDKETYQQYLATQTEYERRERAKEQSRKTEEQPAEHVDPKCRELVEEGRHYIQYVHECNDRIPDETMSAKLERLELVITRIFAVAEKDPEVVDDLKKMMSYYLPTTKKLLDTYCEMDKQQIQGQNIENTKKEIENALDTVNTAFENLLDSLFQDVAWDISSDISVLNTMLAQEGLTGKDFAGR